MTKVAIASMIKNECDIIELFLRINIREVDSIFLIDHNSTDATPIIVDLLIKEYPTISYTLHDNPSFLQAAVMTNAVRQIADLNLFDYIIPLDADEFIASKNQNQSIRNILKNHIDKDQIGLIPWATYCPINDHYFKSKAPLYEDFRKRKKEFNQFYKVAIGNEFAKNCFIAEGNHFATNQKYTSPTSILPIYIQHTPIRSAEQIIRKTVLGSHTMALKHTRSNNEGLHWDLMAKKIRQQNYILSFEELQEMSFAYATNEGDNYERSIDEDFLRIGTPNDEIKYKSYATPNIIQSLDLFIKKLIQTRNI